MDSAAGIPTPGRSLWVLRELVWQCNADVFGHAESPFKRLLHGTGRELLWLERAGNAWRFPLSSSRSRPRDAFSAAAPLRFAFARRASHAFHARLPRLAHADHVRRLLACPVAMVGVSL